MAEKKAISLTDLLENKELTSDAVRGILSAFGTPESLHIVIDALGKQIDSEKMSEAEAVWHLFWFQQLAYNDFIRTVGFFIEDGGLDVDEFRALLREEYGPVQAMCCDFLDKHSAKIKDTPMLKDILKKLLEKNQENILPEQKMGGAVLEAWNGAGQLKLNDKGEYITAGSPQDFCFWLNTQKASDIPPPETTAKILANDVNLETWKRYYREAELTKTALRG